MRPKILTGRITHISKTQANSDPCLWELSPTPSRENHPSLQSCSSCHHCCKVHHTLKPMLGKWDEGQRQPQQYIFPLSWKVPNSLLIVWLPTNLHCSPTPTRGSCSKNGAVTHPLKSCPNQTVFPYFLHPCYMLHCCAAREGRTHTRTACKISSHRQSSSSSSDFSRACNLTSPYSIRRSMWIHNHRFILSRPMFC